MSLEGARWLPVGALGTALLRSCFGDPAALVWEQFVMVLATVTGHSPLLAHLCGRPMCALALVHVD